MSHVTLFFTYATNRISYEYLDTDYVLLLNKLTIISYIVSTFYNI